MAIIDVLISGADILVPIYTVIAVFSIIVFARSERLANLNKEVRNAVYQFVKPISNEDNSQDPEAWKKNFMGNFTLLRREGLKEVNF